MSHWGTWQTDTHTKNRGIQGEKITQMLQFILVQLFPFKEIGARSDLAQYYGLASMGPNHHLEFWYSAMRARERLACAARDQMASVTPPN